MSEMVKNVGDFLNKLKETKSKLKEDLLNEYIKKLKEESIYSEDKLEIYKKEINVLEKERLLAYRGHNIHNWKLEPSLYRKDYRKLLPKENMIINDAIIKYPNDLMKHDTNFEKLAFLQHYTIPTRLLDLTENPLVALFFACFGTNKTQEASVIMLSINEDIVKYNSSDSVSILSAFSRLSNDKIKAIESQFEEIIKKSDLSGVKAICKEHLTRNIQQKLFETFLNRYATSTENIKEEINKSLNKCANIEYLIHEIKAEKPYFKSIIKMDDYDNRILCVRTKLSNPRIIAQQGLFLLFGIISSDKTKLPQTNLAKYKDKIYEEKITIDKKFKASILIELKSLGISEERLFPEFSNSGKSLLEKYK